jgi:hypothetical protein
MFCKGMVKTPRGKPGHTKGFLAQARASAERGDMVYDDYARNKTLTVRGITFIHISLGLNHLEAIVGTNPQSIRFDKIRGVFSRKIKTKLGLYDFYIIGYFFLSEKEEYPHIFTIHTAFVDNDLKGEIPLDIWERADK